MKIMKYTYIILLFVFSSCISNKKVLLSGTIIIQEDNYIDYEVVVNDTIAKIKNLFEPKGYWYSKIASDESLFGYVYSDGEFEIMPRIKDTIFFKARGYFSQKYPVSELIKRDTIIINLKARKCEKIIECNEEPETVIILGKKQEVIFEEPKKYCEEDDQFIPFNDKYLATFEVIETLHGQLNNKQLKFITYDHYSDPKFAYYEHSIIYLFRKCGTYYNSKHRYQDIYKTVDGRWASPYNPNHHRSQNNKSNITPIPIDFLKSVIYKYHKDLSKNLINRRYPKPYYKHFKGYVKAVYGNYIPELLKINRKPFIESVNRK